MRIVRSYLESRDWILCVELEHDRADGLLFLDLEDQSGVGGRPRRRELGAVCLEGSDVDSGLGRVRLLVDRGLSFLCGLNDVVCVLVLDLDGEDDYGGGVVGQRLLDHQRPLDWVDVEGAGKIVGCLHETRLALFTYVPYYPHIFHNMQ